MTIFFLASEIPRLPHDTRAPSVLVNEAIYHFVKAGNRVCLQLIMMEPRRELTTEEVANLRRIESLGGVKVLPHLWPEDIPPQRLAKLCGNWFFCLQTYYPYARLGPELASRVLASKADVIYSMYSPAALAAAWKIPRTPKGILYGNLDHKPKEMRIKHPELFNGRRVRSLSVWRQRIRLAFQRRWFFRMLQHYQLVLNSSALDADLLRKAGVPQARYIQNMWPLPPEGDYSAQRRKCQQLNPLKICASIGGLQGTANTFGLYFLGRELAPALAQRLSIPCELHVFGARQPTPAVAAALQHPLIRIRGYVQDIDRELLECPIFVVCNNAGDYKAQHTRFLHAWSLSACIIAHADNRITMPELIHGRNVLLARTAAEFATLINQAASDNKLREQIGEGGRETYLREFTPKIVIGRIAVQLEEACTSTLAAGNTCQ